MLSVYLKRTEVELSTRRLEVLEKYNKIIQYGRMNPVWFIENIFKVELLDYQSWVIMNSWATTKSAWVMSRNAGKSILAGLYMMAKSVLFPNFNTWIMSLTATQAQDTFTKLEKIAKHQIASIVGSSDVFINEVVRQQANSDGFIHDKQSYRTQLFNGSTITSLVGRPENVVGKRSHLNVYDEAGKLTHDFFALTEPFTAQNADFKTGRGVDLSILPSQLPTQCLYMSSAEDVSSHLYEVYKECAMSMAMGFKDKFVADINCEMPLHPTKHGKPQTALLKQTEVDDAMRMNEYRALREYYNIFDTTGGTDAVVSRSAILRNEQPYLPVTENDRTGTKKYVICYDPALMADNSFILVGEIFKEEESGEIKGRIINGYNLVETLPNGEKKILTSLQQLEFLRKLILLYNGGAPDYENIILFIDPGSGGGGHIYSDFLMPDWTDELGKKHRGLIDMEDEKSALEAMKFPNAVKDVLHLYTANKYKNDMFAAAGDLIARDMVYFPVSVPNRGKIELDGRQVTLSKDEVRGLLEIDLAKEEMLSMKKSKTESGNVRYALSIDKARKQHDDRAYTLAAFCYILSLERRKQQFDIAPPRQDMAVLLQKHKDIRQAAKAASNRSPFAGRRPTWLRGR